MDWNGAVVTAVTQRRNCRPVPTIVREEKKKEILPAAAEAVVIEDSSAVMVFALVMVLVGVHPDWNCPNWKTRGMWKTMWRKRIPSNRLDWDWYCCCY